MLVLLPGKAIGKPAKALWAAYRDLKASKSPTISGLSAEHGASPDDVRRVLKDCKFQAPGIKGPAFTVTDKGSVRLSTELKTALSGGGAR
jgi:hypothetical protein